MLSDYQELMKTMYGERDAKRGAERTLLWLVSELGEVADALVKGDREALRGELADVLAWLLSFSNVVGIDIGEAFLGKYGDGCPNCRKKICECVTI